MKVKESIKKNKTNIITFLVMLCFSIVMCNGFVRMHYTADSYKIADWGYEKYMFARSLKDGRIFMFIFLDICNIINLPLKWTNYISEIFGLNFSCLSVMIIRSIIVNLKEPKTKWQIFLVDIISYLTIFNFMYIEVLYFIETIVISLSVLLFTLAAKEIVLSENKYIPKSIIYSILATFSYQGTIGYFLVLICALIIIKNKDNIKEILKKFGIVILCSGISVILNLIAVKVICNYYGYEQTRLALNKVLFNIGYFIENMRYIIINSCGMIGQGVFVGILGLFEIIIIGYSLEKRQYKNIWISILIILISIVLSFAMFIGTNSSFEHGRMYVGLGALPMIIIMYAYIDMNILQEKSFYEKALIIFVMFYFVLNTSNYIRKIENVQLKNKLEKEYSEKIVNYIKENNLDVKYAVIVDIRNHEEELYFQEIKDKDKDNLTINELKGHGAAISGLIANTDIKLQEIEDEKIENEYRRRYEEGNRKGFIGDTYSAIIDNILVMPAFIG